VEGAAQVTSTSAGRTRPIVGVLIDNVDDDYQRAIWAGLESAAREADASVVTMVGGDLDPSDEVTRRRNAIFGLLSPASVDGLVVVSTVAATLIGIPRLEEHCRRYRPLPMVSLGFRLESMPSIVCENQLGLREVIEHLVDRHGRRRLLFLGGPPTNADAVERERIFRETLEGRGLPIDPRLVLRGDFRADRAYAALRGALAEGLAFDAVVAANDAMAIATMTALEEAGVRLPDAVSVTGFDDVLGAQRLTLPLTTVRQPTFEVSRRAMQILLGMLRGETPAPLERQPTQVVIRRSCGCFSEAVRRAGAPRALERIAAPAAPAVLVAPDLADALVAALRPDASAPGPAGAAELEALVRAFAAELGDSAAEGTFVARLDAALRDHLSRGAADGPWEDLLTALRRAVVARLAQAPPGALVRAEALLHQGRVLLREAARQEQWRLHASLAQRTQTLQYAIDVLIGSFDLPALLDNMARELPRIGIRRCYLAVHADPARPYSEAKLLLAYDPRGRLPIPPEGIAYAARELLPRAALDGPERFHLLLQPLVFGDEELGFLAIEHDPLGPISSLALAEQIRSALKASMVMQEVQKKDRRLLELDRTKNDFIANVTHDFRSFLTIILDSCWLAMEADEVRGMAEVKELSSMAYEAALKLKVEIDRLLDLASMDERGLALKIRHLRPRAFLAALAAFYRPVLAMSGIALEEDFPAAEIEDLYTDPDKLEQILHNLISNAARAVEPGKGTIRLQLAAREGAVEIAVADDGVGIAPDQLEAIFARFKSLGMRKGSGIGLAFVRALADYLRGMVAAESEGLGKGARFVLTLWRGHDVFEVPAGAEEAGDGGQAAVLRGQLRLILESDLREKAGRSRPASP
jgi:DNA-binding LacI/PurR family transcriptional regulator/signal transduction histidine kinase